MWKTLNAISYLYQKQSINLNPFQGTVKFKQEGACIQNRDGEVILVAKTQQDLFLFKTNDKKCFGAQSNVAEIMKWYNRFGNLNFGSLNKMISKNLVHGLKKSLQ